MRQSATIPAGPAAHHKSILIVDEARFSRICAAILELEGFSTQSISDVSCAVSALGRGDVGLIIMSYPFGVFLFEEVMRMDVPVILLTDHLSGAVMRALGSFKRCHCMIKPIDYQELRSVVRQCIHIQCGATGGCRVV